MQGGEFSFSELKQEIYEQVIYENAIRNHLGHCRMKIQIEDGENGFLVNSVEETAKRMVQLCLNQGLGERMGQKGRETVRDRFKMTKLMENYLDLSGGFEPHYTLKM